MDVKKIAVLITSGQPSLNPRLVKEADSLTELGYEVIVIYQYWNAWATKLDEQLLATKKWKSIKVGGDPVYHKFIYWKTRIRQKIANTILKKVNNHSILAESAIGRCTSELIAEGKKTGADLYIAHNLAALPAVVKAANKNKAKCGFDAEDFHRYEMSDDDNDYGVKLKRFIEEKYFSKVDYLTTSSPEITRRYSNVFPKLIFKTILNVFPKYLDSTLKSETKKPLRLIWFSQNVGLKRGLQDVFIALRKIENYDIEFHILGFLPEETKKGFEELVLNLSFNIPPKVFFYPPIAQDRLQKFIGSFDIGLALEPGFSINNNAALSNKIFTYIQSGLAVIVSDTVAQQKLLEHYPDMGTVFKKINPHSLVNILKAYADDSLLLLKHQQQAKEYGEETLNWEVESKKFLTIVEGMFKS